MKKQKCEKEWLPRPIFGVLGIILQLIGNPEGSPNREKGNRKRGPKMDTKKGRDYATAWGVGGWGGGEIFCESHLAN